MGYFKKCIVVKIPTDDWQLNLIIKHKTNGLYYQIGKIKNESEFIYKAGGVTQWKYNFIPYHLYFLSDEEIKEGDWFYDFLSPTAWKSAIDVKYPSKFDHKKIIASTDKKLELPNIPDRFLWEFCSQTDGINEIEIEYACIPADRAPNGYDYYPIITVKNTVVTKIPKINWTKQELLLLTESAFSEGVKAGQMISELPTPRNRYDDWIKENL